MAEQGPPRSSPQPPAGGTPVWSRASCLKALAVGGLGRVALTAAALPVILPVHYALLGEDVVFVPEAEPSLEASLPRSIVAFEADDVDDAGRGWSVCVTGVVEELPQTAPELDAERLGLANVHDGVDGPPRRYLRLRSQLVVGRALGAGSAPA